MHQTNNLPYSQLDEPHQTVPVVVLFCRKPPDCFSSPVRTLVGTRPDAKFVAGPASSITVDMTDSWLWQYGVRSICKGNDRGMLGSSLMSGGASWLKPWLKPAVSAAFTFFSDNKIGRRQSCFARHVSSYTSDIKFFGSTERSRSGNSNCQSNCQRCESRSFEAAAASESPARVPWSFFALTRY